MSAKNWRGCPQCEARRRKQISDLEALIVKSYGKASLAVHKGRLAQLDVLSKGCLSSSLAEWYEHSFLTDDESGKSWFQLSYNASCEHCGFSFKTNYKTPVTLKKESDE